jgi:hypothetical protein
MNMEPMPTQCARCGGPIVSPYEVDWCALCELEMEAEHQRHLENEAQKDCEADFRYGPIEWSD